MTITIHAIKKDVWPGGLLIRFEPASETPSLKTAGKKVGDLAPDPAANQVIVSLGKHGTINQERIRQAGGALAKWLKKQSIEEAGIDLETLTGFGLNVREAAFAVSEGILLGEFEFTSHKSGQSPKPTIKLTFLTENAPDEVSVAVYRASIIAEATNLARAWSHEPANIINPVTLAERVSELAHEAGLKCTILDDKQLSAMGANAIVAVGQASATPSRLIILEHVGDGSTKPVALVGKALTFDTGGYSLKTVEGIVGMKYDKCGGMAVIGAMLAAARLNITTPVIGVIGAAENMISGSAYRPNDIIKTLSGTTVEVISTDAEGRLVLADALTYTQKKYHPRAIIDLATLTGGVITALGSVRAGLMANNDELAEALYRSGERTCERLWRMPLDDEYFEQIKGDDSDIKNSGGKKAQVVIGGIFLKQFIEDTPWAHLDIAGVAFGDKDLPYCPKGGTGFGVRLVVDYLRQL